MNLKLDKNTYLSATGIKYSGRLHKIKKSDDKLQPIFEAFTNSFEAILLSKKNKQSNSLDEIILKFHFTSFDKFLNFQTFSIEDTGIGFNDENFDRIFNFDDESKGFNNKGSGRVQYLHYFDKAEYLSIYEDKQSKTGYKKRTFKLSKTKAFIEKNAIIFYEDTIDFKSDKSKTILTLNQLLNSQDISFYNQLDIEELKQIIINHYLLNFCVHRNSLPLITIQDYIDNKLNREITISEKDIPKKDQEKPINISYSKISADRKVIETTGDKAEFIIKCFKINKEQLKENEIKLTSKGEIATSKIKLDVLKPDEHINNYRYLFLISSDYLNDLDEDNRGDLQITSKDDFKKKYRENPMYSDNPEILLDDIQEQTNNTVLLMYNEIKQKIEEKTQKIEELKKMFLLSDEAIKEAKFGINDTEDKILEKVYAADARVVAKKDAEMKNQLERIDSLDTTADDYFEKLEQEVNDLVKAIPLQNRTALTHYVARRKLVLDLFDKIQRKQLEIQKTGNRNIDEKLLHNLIFQQNSSNPEKSDLWLINEDFIYFKGKSEGRLNQVEIDGQKLFKETFTKEEDEYLLSLGENRKINKPDILLFPEEGKCIIIEFKNLGVNVSDHLTQINKYAYLIRNFTNDDFQIETFYGYLIGEAINPFEVQSADSDFKIAYKFDYLFRPAKTVLGIKNRLNGSIYMEVIKYSTLLERASQRNRIFLEKIMA
ncbi:MAG: ATP-binding protein [Bacteroidales bacterium]|nr:ATP-binding protein [Bacteroidales bacterium]